MRTCHLSLPLSLWFLSAAASLPRKLTSPLRDVMSSNHISPPPRKPRPTHRLLCLAVPASLSAMSLADLVFSTVVAPLAAVWSIASRPCLALLRCGKLAPPPVDLSAAEEDLSGRVIIVTGANTGDWSNNSSLFDATAVSVWIEVAQQFVCSLFICA